MSIESFKEWLDIFRVQFPDDDRLRTLGVSWYPGTRDPAYEEQLDDFRTIGEADGCWFTFTTWRIEDRIRICVQGPGEAYFHLDPLELDGEPWRFEAEQLARIRQLIESHQDEIRDAWRRFRNFAREAHQRWSAKLGVPSVWPVTDRT